MLEKILQEIKEAAIFMQTMSGYGAMCVSTGAAERIIRRHMNDGWIPVEDGLPETNTKVDVTFREWMPYSKKYRYGTCNAVYIPEKTVKAEEMWSDYEEDYCVDYDEKTDTVYAIGGWYETIEHWDEYSHCYINCEVIAWRPLPEHYRKDGE